jgi:hypothetical protein
MRRRRHFLALVSALSLAISVSAAPLLAQPDETAGMITEIKVRHGKVEMKTADGDWRRALPLNVVRAGDQVRAVGDATVVVLLTGGRGTILVEAKSSPYTVAASRLEKSTGQKARVLLSTTLGFLVTAPKEPPKAVTSSRSVARPPEVVTPRNGVILSDSPVFEWLGDQFARYRVRILDPTAVVLERRGVVGPRFAYPPDAPRLQTGVRYRVQVEAAGLAPTEAWFEVADETRAAETRENLRRLEAGLGATVSPSSLAVVRVGALAADGLFHDARLVTLAALKRDPDEPALHMLLGSIYLKTGLPGLAAQSLEEAQSLLSRGEK